MASEVRNPWIKNAFLALSYIVKSPKFKGGMKRKIRSFCLVYVRVRPHAVLCKVYKQRGVFVFLFISFMVFGDTYYVMSVTSPYAFLVPLTKHENRADFGGLISNG